MMEEVSWLTGRDFECVPVLQHLHLVWPHRGKLLQLWLPAPLGSPLHALWRESEEISVFTLFDPASVVILILTGIAPLLPDGMVGMDFGKVNRKGTPLEGTKQWPPICGIVRIYSRDVTYARFRELYRDARTWLLNRPYATGRPIGGAQHKLLTLVESWGACPRRRTTREFWERVVKEWNSRSQRAQRYDDWHAPMMAYRRLKAKIKRRSATQES